jgi:hypothetical protein
MSMGLKYLFKLFGSSVITEINFVFLILIFCKGKGKDHPITCHEGTEGK